MQINYFFFHTSDNFNCLLFVFDRAKLFSNGPSSALALLWRIVTGFCSKRRVRGRWTFSRHTGSRGADILWRRSSRIVCHCTVFVIWFIRLQTKIIDRHQIILSFISREHHFDITVVVVVVGRRGTVAGICGCGGEGDRQAKLAHVPVAHRCRHNLRI